MPGFYWVFQLQGDKETLNVTNMTAAPSGMWTIFKDENGQSYPETRLKLGFVDCCEFYVYILGEHG